MLDLGWALKNSAEHLQAHPNRFIPSRQYREIASDAAVENRYCCDVIRIVRGSEGAKYFADSCRR